MSSENDEQDEKLRYPDIAMLRLRNEISQLADDTAVEEPCAALFLVVSVKKMAEWRANGGGPEFIKPRDPNAKGRNQPVSYEMRELRRFRTSMKAGSNLEVARKQGLVGWVSGIEPFWMTAEKLIIGSALRSEDLEWGELFCKAVRKDIDVAWMAPREAVGAVWTDAGQHKNFAEEFLLILKGEVAGIGASIEASEVNSVLGKKG